MVIGNWHVLKQMCGWLIPAFLKIAFVQKLAYACVSVSAPRALIMRNALIITSQTCSTAFQLSLWHLLLIK